MEATLARLDLRGASGSKLFFFSFSIIGRLSNTLRELYLRGYAVTLKSFLRAFYTSDC